MEGEEGAAEEKRNGSIGLPVSSSGLVDDRSGGVVVIPTSSTSTKEISPMGKKKEPLGV